ncbi:hypothetical protein [Pseudoclavibacter terrae]|uniref:hypothetical protein n=1 Tax=Pseudoclavibacter terrae TaxID=1530195 RepID=UPI00232E18E0|nr:hypothetical protein [Pseudoclavibacter terrae]
MTATTPPLTAARWVAAILTALGLALGVTAVGLSAAPAHAAGQVTISGQPTADGQSEIQVSGTGFQSVQGGFGGIYVLFGWVDDPSGGSWKPSAGGVTGEDYRYVYDDETNPVGYQLFAAFPGGSTSYAANGGEVAADGTWSGTLRIPGAVFQTYDRDQNATSVDCNAVQCGIITIGAHGVKNTNNESFTPLTFTGGAAAAAPQAQATTQQSEAAAPAAPVEQAPPADAAPVATSAPVGAVTQNTASSQGLGSVSDALAWLVVLAPVLLLVGLTVVGLAVGIGAYLAAKSLLLGVNPAALEKVRGQRERKALREREKQRRKTAAVRLAQEQREARARRRLGAAAAQQGLVNLPASPAPLENDKLVDFFAMDAPIPRHPSPLGDAAAESAPGGRDAPTLILSSATGRREDAR